jgi:hypothetical protein
VPIPLNVDAMTVLGLDLTNTPLLQNFLGVLDAQGRAAPTLDLPATVARALVGLRLNVVGGGLDKQYRLFVTNPTELYVEL